MEQPDTDLTYVLPRHLYQHALHVLRAALPPPATDTQEDLVRRDHAAMAQIASLLPANAEEVILAAQYVAASAQALDCLRLVRNSPADTILGLKCTAQSASMMRQARGARSLLIRVQAQRQKREANAVACDTAAQIEHCAIGLMSDALIAGATTGAQVNRMPAPQSDGAASAPARPEPAQYAAPAGPGVPDRASIQPPDAPEQSARQCPGQHAGQPQPGAAYVQSPCEPAAPAPATPDPSGSKAAPRNSKTIPNPADQAREPPTDPGFCAAA